MKLTATNWLKLLRDDILARQTLYPDGGDVGRLTSTNWLKKLRDNILARQTLYPTSEPIGLITSTNFLVLLMRDILKRGTLYPDDPRSLLAAAINAAQKLLDATLVSADGSDIYVDQFWTTAAVRVTFSNAVVVAQAVLNNPLADDDMLTDARIALEAAHKTFDSARQPGTMPKPIDGWEITYIQPSQVTMQRIIIPLENFTGYTPDKLADMNGPDGVYDKDWKPTGNVRMYYKYVFDTEWIEATLDEPTSIRPFNRLTYWEWQSPNTRITGDNSTGEPIQLRLVKGA